jgi:WD40 repeat protein
MIVGSADGAIDVWDPAHSWPPLARISTGSATVAAAALNAKGDLAVTGSDDGTVRVWAVRPRKLVSSRKAPNGDLVSAVAFDPNPAGRNRILIAFGFAGNAIIWDWQGGHQDIQLGKPVSTPNSLVLTRQLFGAAFSPDARLVVTTHRDKVARLWDANNGRRIRTLAGHTGIVYNAAFSSVGAHLVTASGDGTVRVWETTSGQLLRTMTGNGDAIRAASFSRDGGLIAAGDAKGTTLVWEVANERLLAVLRRHADSVNSIVFMGDGQIVTASDDGTAKRYPCNTCDSLAHLLEKARERERYVQR